MGNCFTKRNTESYHRIPSFRQVKVRMPIREYKELVSQTDVADLGQLILQASSKGKYQARAVDTFDDHKDDEECQVKCLETIQEN
ncbi:hypothetical protein MRB53_026811 [Persea americana]|uniref:Uncharacterized protein n=1 Tax=Persea americana TaxID=3435 RepID=A0ACC2LJE9_PERAE|nr:hypothetical protein MRB53_026811 [Persea americana]